MGQYHKPVNITKKEMLHPHKLGDGLKVLEFGCSSNGTMTALAILLAGSNKGGSRGGGDLDSQSPLVGSWAGDHIAIIGDYSEQGDVPGMSKLEMDAVWSDDSGFTDISEEMLKVMTDDEYILRDIFVDYKCGNFGSLEDLTWLDKKAEDNDIVFDPQTNEAASKSLRPDLVVSVPKKGDTSA